MWLQVHNLFMDWEKCKVFFQSEYCRENCIGGTVEDDRELAIMEIAVVSEEEKQTIPSKYHNLIEVFDIL